MQNGQTFIFSNKKSARKNQTGKKVRRQMATSTPRSLSLSVSGATRSRSRPAKNGRVSWRQQGGATRSSQELVKFLLDPMYAANIPQPRDPMPQFLVAGLSRGLSTFTSSGASANYAFYVQVPTVGHIGYSFLQTTSNATGTTMTHMLPTYSTPPVASIAADNVKSARLVASLTSNLLNAAGLCLFGHIPSDTWHAANPTSLTTNLNWDTALQLPGVRMCSIQEFARTGLTIFGRKASASADAFTGDADLIDYLCPFVAFYSPSVAQGYMVNMDAAFDVMPAIGATSSYGPGISQGINAFSPIAFSMARHALSTFLPSGAVLADATDSVDALARGALNGGLPGVLEASARILNNPFASSARR